jgi:hypothetical protein
MILLRSSAVILALLSASVAFSQDASCLRRTLPISVLFTQKTGPMSMAPTDFRAEFHGKPVQILSFSRGIHPHRVLILLDASGSMKGEIADNWDAAVYTADQFAESNLSTVSLGLFIFRQKSGEKIGFSQDNSRVRERLRQILADRAYRSQHVYGMTPLIDAVEEGARMFGSPRPGDAILLISDGGENASRSKFKALPEGLLEKGIRLFFCFLVIPRADGFIPEEIVKTYDFDQVAETTGGYAIQPFRGETPFGVSLLLSGHPQPRTLAILSELDMQLAGYNLIEVQLPFAPTKLDRWELSLSKEKSREFKDAKLLYPHELLPCSSYEPFAAGSSQPH